MPESVVVLVEETGQGRFQQRITAGRHVLLADEPASVGGMDTGFGPYDLLLAAVGACSAMTVRLYAERKGLPLDRVAVRLRHAKIHVNDCADCETKGDAKIDEIDKRLSLFGPLDAEQRARLVEIAGRCPVHRTLESEIKIRTTLDDGVTPGRPRRRPPGRNAQADPVLLDQEASLERRWTRSSHLAARWLSPVRRRRLSPPGHADGHGDGSSVGS